LGHEGSGEVVGGVGQDVTLTSSHARSEEGKRRGK
jgi:hypothetical protein